MQIIERTDASEQDDPRDTPAAVMGRLYQSRLATSPVPSSWHADLIGYLAHRRPVGQFLKAVLENNLRETLRYASVQDRARLVDLVAWLNWDVPAGVWGSKEVVARHLAGREQS